ncbi:MAG TPA: HipA domain-containing protein [Solirubrobacterales bacterium]|nr:HipA domain-containing protein [Solirubrobacterales bacterium]
MTSEPQPQEAYVWVWLPGARDPVVAGRLEPVGPIVNFTYARSYLAREERISLYEPELPLVEREISPRAGEIAGCIADAGPDAWGQRVILNHRVGEEAEDTADLSYLTYLLDSGSDRIGALDFQSSPEDYVPRSKGEAQLAELSQLAESAQKVEEGEPLSETLDQALLHGSSVGGARPKALLHNGPHRLIAKFSSSTDKYAVVKGEFASMELARRAGIDAAKVELTEALGRDALLIERFDRPKDGGRRAVVSALTMLGLDEMSGRYASYADLADLIRAMFTEPTETLRELFARITFNILTGNSDDHARNHAAFWDGTELTLTPAYDICPQPRAGGETSQAMAIGADGWRMGQVAGCVERAQTYRLSKEEARAIIDRQIEVIESQWDEVCDLAKMTRVDRSGFWNRQFLNPYALEGHNRL